MFPFTKTDLGVQLRLKFCQMFIKCFTFFLFFGLKEIVHLKDCPPVSFPRHGKVSCLWEKQRRVCGSYFPVGSIAEFTCEEFYRLSLEGKRFIECQLNGSWNSTAPKCVPDCGLKNEFGGLVVKGLIASLKDFPWHVGIYYLIDGNYEYWCGGTLVSESAIITAAHCVWEISPSKLMLVFGKFHRDYYLLESTAQKIKAKKIEIPRSYQDVGGNYNGDLAIVFLEDEVKLGHYSTPICVDWDQRLTNKQLAPGTFGETVGWGLTENDTLSDSLRTVMLPVISDEDCIAEQERDFKKFVTFTSFCAGLKNGTGVCNGDSGGGLTFFDEGSTRWYLQGLVSVSPRRKGTPYCDLNYYTIFTKVNVFSKWIKGVIENEQKISSFDGSFEQLPRTEKDEKSFLEIFRKYLERASKKKISYPHTKKMLELAGFSNRLQNMVRR